jgi:hypothetical protein
VATVAELGTSVFNTTAGNASVPQYDYVLRNKLDSEKIDAQQGAVGRNATRMQGLRREWKRNRRGILVPEMRFA